MLIYHPHSLQDVNEVNGGTLLIPGSHKIVSAVGPDEEVGPLPPAVNTEARAGTVLMMDGRLLHGTGVNHTDDWRYIMTQSNVKPWMRQQENWTLTVAPDVLRTASRKLLQRMGFASSGLLEVGSFSSMTSTVDIRLRLDEGNYRRIGQLKSPVPPEVRDQLTIHEMKEQTMARRRAQRTRARL
jgi:hypothetical protein